MTAENFKYLGPVLDMLQCLVLVVLWLRKPGQDAGQKAQQALTNAAELEGRLNVIEERMKHMPSDGELADLAGTVKAIEATLESLQQGQETMRKSTSRIEDFLLRRQG